MDERTQLSQSGVLIIVATVDMIKFQILSGPNIVSRGFIYVRESGEMIKKAESITLRLFRELCDSKESSTELWEKRIVAELTAFFFEHTEHSPMILPIILRV